MTTTREAIELAREAGFITLGEDFVIRLIDLAKQQENEACAKVCDESVTSWHNTAHGHYDGTYDYMGNAAQQIAEEIRSRMK